MKSKELIKQLLEVDPSGETEVCVGNADIWNLTAEPAYYDGALQVIERDAENRPVKGRRVRAGQKVNIDTIRIEDAFEYEDFVIEYTSDEDRARYEKMDLESRRQDHETDFNVEQSIFASWVFLKIQSAKPIPLGWVSRIEAAAKQFYKENRGPDADGKAIEAREWGWQRGSWADRLHEIWEELIHVEWDNYSRIIIKFKP